MPVLREPRGRSVSMTVTPSNLDAVLEHFPHRRQNSPTDWHASCPGHADSTTNPEKYSLHITVAGDKILLHCFAGCSQDRVLEAAQLTAAALFLSQSGNGHPQADPVGPRDVKPTLALFAQLKRIPQGTLEALGWRNHDDGLAIPYPTRDGSLWRMRYRTSMRPGAGFKWDGQKDRPLIPYGRHRLDQVMEKGELWLVEGESDAVTAWTHGLPCLAFPGNSTVKALTTEDLVGIERLWIVREPGQSGEGFVTQLRDRLAALGWTGAARIVELPAKDLSDLHVLKPGEFWPAIKAAQEQAEDLMRWTPAGPAPATEAAGPVPLGIGLGRFLALEFPPVAPYIEGILTSDGPGWIAGEEKLGKTIWALDEALSLALCVTLCGRFHVPQRRRVLFIEEEDSPRRTHTRLRALLRGHGLDPDDPGVQADVDVWFTVAVWQGFTFDQRDMIARLERTITELQPAVVYLDVLRKLTTKSVRDDVDMSPLLAILDDLRRRFGCLFRVVHHYRKGQGFRTGRGSQELGGSYVLGAWGENSVFLEPIGRKQGAVKVEIQQKDGPPVPGFRLTIESEGPHHAPTLLRLVASEAPDEATLDDIVLQAVATLDKTEALAGRPGVDRLTLIRALKKSESTIRRALKRLTDAKLILVTGYATKQQALYGVNE